MKRITLSFLLLGLSLFAFSQAAKDKEAIKQVIEKSYVQGLQNWKNVEDINKGFHPGFNLLGINEQNNLTKYPIYTWSENVSKAAEAGQTPGVVTTAKYPMIDVTGNAAVAKVELYKEGKQIFTDYLSLYKFEEGWRVVSKIYYRIPR